MEGDITVVLTLYKRPHVLLQQLNSIRQQSIRPKQIIIWKNYVNDDINIPSEISQDKSIIIIDCNKNLGVWPRFTIGLIATTEFVAVFDDDTIPGNKWFENCLTTINIHNGLLGSIGLVFSNSDNYYNENYLRYGWDNPNDDVIEVDFVGHAWFFRRIWILELCKITPDYDKFLICGEDMGFSWALQQIGINTYVPPHPSNNLEMFGSIPDFAWNYGTESVAISQNQKDLECFESMFQFYKNNGFKFVKNKNKVVQKSLNNSNSIEHVNFYIEKIINKEPFSLIRPGDGEFMIIKGEQMTTQDRWSFKGGDLQHELLTAIRSCKLLSNCYVGIPCPDCIKGSSNYDSINLSEFYELEKSRTTYANIFCNRNWRIFCDFLISQKIPIFYLGPGQEPSNSLNIIDRFYVNELQIETWDTDKNIFKNNLYSWISSKLASCNNLNSHPMIFTFSMGPLSKIIIPELSSQYPNHYFLDIGSSFDTFLKNDHSRPYLHSDSPYHNLVCDFNHGHSSDIPANLPIEDFVSEFAGGWSYSQNEMRDFLKFLTIRNSYHILEFGAGKSTTILYDIISNFCKSIEYDTYEHDLNYKVSYKNINTIMYQIDDLDNLAIPNKKYDLIFIDGPHGTLRAKWYAKIRNHVKYNTIMLIDDYNHYSEYEYEYELNKNFSYKIFSLSDVPFCVNGEHSWRIITNILIKDIN